MAHRITAAEVRAVMSARRVSRIPRRKAADQAARAFSMAWESFMDGGAPTTWPPLVAAARALLRETRTQ
jgi:hypothetical protein